MKLALVALLATAACEPIGRPHQPATTYPAPLAQVATTRDLVGTWAWSFASEVDNTARAETERWYFLPADPATPGTLRGRYTRDVEIRTIDRLPFRCNQEPRYRQRAVFDVTAVLDPTTLHFAITETAVQAEVSPCDHGLRKTARYEGTLANGTLALAFPGGSQTLHQTSRAEPVLPAPPWPLRPPLFGAWRWTATSYDDDGNIRDETEWWELTRKSETRIDATYRRRVTVRSPDGVAVIPCAHGPLWRFDDAYVLEGTREEEHWRFIELAVEPGDHACMRTTPRRALDEMTVEQLGDYLLVEWRGKRRQVLHR